MFLQLNNELINISIVEKIRMGYPLYGEHPVGTTEVYIVSKDKQISVRIFKTREEAIKFLEEITKQLLTKPEVVIL